jgi:HPt (histidine-containing phosphotransfer) domain-containing protein
MLVAAIDRSALEQLVDDISLEDTRRIVGVFAEDVRRSLLTLEDCAEAGDLGGWQSALHSIAGASGAVGGTALEMVARRGMARRDGAIAGLVSESAAVREIAEQTLSELEACMATMVEAR